jgi:hypothetical protein
MAGVRVRKLSNPRSVARAIKEFVLAEEKWNQHLWLSAAFFDNHDMQATGTELRKLMTENVCGTECCVAGGAVILTIPANAKYDYDTETVKFKDGRSEYVQSYAQRVMGLTSADANWLFDGDRRRRDVLAALDLLIAGKSIRPLWDEYDEYNDDGSYRNADW